jgi:GT2 family glycosyltransferase
MTEMMTSDSERSFISNITVPEVAIVILNWENYPDTAECLSSVKETVYPNYRVIVVDNGSSDGSGEKLQNEFEWCEFIFNDQNLGFSAGCNKGIAHALETGADYILLLNNDMNIQPTTLEGMVDTAESGDDVAAVGGIIRDATTGGIWYAGGEVSLLTASVSVSERVLDSEPYETGFISGAMILLSSDYLREGELLNEDYFFAMEDTEFAYRAIQDGWRLLVNPDAEVEHKVSASSGDGTAFRHYHSAINRLVFAKNNLSWQYRLLFYLFFSSSRIVRFGQWLLNGETELIWATSVGIYDYFRSGKPKKQIKLIPN